MLLLITSNVALAQKTITLTSGQTRVALAPSFVSALSGLGVHPGVIAPTELRSGVVNFPIVGGAVDLDTAKGQILHSGGLTLTAGATQVRLQSFIIDTTGASPVITGLVVVDNKLAGRLPLFSLALPAGLTLPLPLTDGVLALKGVGVSLTPTAAGALNQVFHVSALQGGFAVGTARVVAVPAGYDDEDDQ